MRGAAISLIILAKLRKYLDTVLQIADLLFTGGIGMVRKERVWLLKKAGRKHQEEGFDYI